MRRPVLPADVNAVARALLCADAKDRLFLCKAIFVAARTARIHVDHKKALHPLWGDGTLNAAARRFPLAQEPAYDDLDYLTCIQIVLAGLKRELG